MLGENREIGDMTIRKRVTIEPGGLIEVRDPVLPDGAEAELVINVELPVEQPAMDADSGKAKSRPIWEVIVEIGASVPPEEWDKVPRDLSKNLKHYLYGSPRHEE